MQFSGYIEKSSLKLCQEWVKNVALPAPETGCGKEKLQNDLAALRELFRFGVAHGALKAGTPVGELADMLNDLLYGEMLCWCIADGAYSFEERTKEFCARFLRGVLSDHLN